MFRWMVTAAVVAVLVSLPTVNAEPLQQMRAEGYAVASRGDCASAYEIFKAVAANSGGTARDHMAAANCAIELGQTDDAIGEIYSALKHREPLGAGERTYALKALANQLEKTGRFAEAADAWDQAVVLEDSPENRIALARALRLAGNTARASQVLMFINNEHLAAPARARYWMELVAQRAATDPAGAAEARAKAIPALEEAHRLDLRDPNIAFDLAYAYYNQRRYAEAAVMFEVALAADRAAYAPVEDWAYALKAQGRNEEAAARFRQVIDNRARYPQATGDERDALERRMWRVRRETGELERTWYMNAFLVYRSPSGGSMSVLESGPFVSQAGVEAGWRPPGIGFINGRIVELYGRALFSFAQDSLTYDEDSLQLGFGVRWKPISDQDLRLSIERLVKAGDNARDAWLLRASYFWGDGVDLDPVESDWNYTTFYGDLAYIPDAPVFLSAYAEAIQGRRFKIAPRWALTPHALLAAQYSNDSFEDRRIVEVGLGVMLSYWFCEDLYTAPSGRLDLQLQYRHTLSDVNEDTTFLLRALLSL